MSTVHTIDRPEPASLLIARVVWLEIRRREEYLALLILMGLYLLFAIGARVVGNTQPEAVSLMLNMGLWISASLSAVLTFITAVRLIPSEIESRTLYPLLAKPVHRGEVVFGKFIATTAAGWGTLTVFCALTSLTWAATFPLPGQHLGMFVQAFILQLGAVMLLCSLSLFLSLVVPRSVALLVMGMLYFGGGSIFNVVRSAVRDTAGSAVVNWLLDYIPNFAKLTLFQRFTDGAPALPMMEWLGLMAYTILLSLLLLAVSTRIFERKAI